MDQGDLFGRQLSHQVEPTFLVFYSGQIWLDTHRSQQLYRAVCSLSSELAFRSD